jgi:hypothetical protein
MVASDHDADFFAGRRSDALPFCVNDTVEVLRGTYAGRIGAVVLLDRSREAFRFLVEFGDGTDELIEPQNLTLAQEAV